MCVSKYLLSLKPLIFNTIPDFTTLHVKVSATSLLIKEISDPESYSTLKSLLLLLWFVAVAVNVGNIISCMPLTFIELILTLFLICSGVGDSIGLTLREMVFELVFIVFGELFEVLCCPFLFP